MTRSVVLSALVLALLASLTFQASAFGAAPRHKVSARLFGPTAMKGKATYEVKPKDGVQFKRFKVEVERGVPGQRLSVRVNNRAVGSFLVNSVGVGKFELRTAQFIDSPGDGQPIPADFPNLDTGDIVVVGPLVGVIYDQLDDSDQRFNLKGSAGGSNTLKAQVKYRERFKNGQLERRFTVEVERAAGVQSFPITVNGKSAGTVTTNALGRAEFQLRTAAFIDSPGDGQPMPSTFPSLKVGDVVKVGSLTVTLKAG